MRTISTDYDAALTATGGTQRRFRVQVKDSGGTFRDLATYAGPDMVVSSTWGETIDTNGHDCSFSVKRAVEKLSLSPFMQNSPVNRAFAYPGTYAPLIDIGREVKVEWSLSPADTPVGTGLSGFAMGFHGYIDSFDPAGGGEVRVTARGQYALALDAFIEVERAYAYASPADPDATKGCRIYQNGDTYVVGELVVPSEQKLNGHFYAVTSITTGIGGTEGAWNTGAGSTTTFGGVTLTEKGVTTTTTGTDVEKVMQQILNDNVSGAPTLTTSVSPAWAIRAYTQDRTGAWTAARALADQIGWDLRYKYNSGLSDYRLELNDVPRSKTTPDRTFGPSRRFRLTRLETKLDGIRNVIRVIFLDSQDLDAQGFPKRKVVTVSDSASIAKYGRRYMEVSEDKTGNIDTTGEATTFANAMLADLKDPVAELEVEMPFFPFVELSDLYRFSADGIHFDVDQDLAVVGYSHQLSAGDSPKAVTTITCRGKPSGGYTRWLMVEAGRTKELTHKLQGLNTFGTTLLTGPTVGGTKLTAQVTFSKHALAAGVEFHISRTPSFTPSNATLVKTGQDMAHVASDLFPGFTYYAQTVPWVFNAGKMVRGQPSPEISFVAGRGGAGHLEQGVEWGRTPLNGGFETWNDTGTLPDHWNTFQTWGTNFTRQTGADGVSGAAWLRFKVQAVGIANIFTNHFTIERDTAYDLSWWVDITTAGTGGSISLGVNWFDYADNFISTDVLDTVAFNEPGMTPGVGNWYRRGGVATAPASARFACVILKQVLNGDMQLDVDSVRFDRA